jgi:hypothetical protein
MKILQVPVVELSHDPANARKQSTCVKCGGVRLIRKDSNATMCRSCASVRPGARPSRKTGTDKPCVLCGRIFYARACEANRRFCSKECSNTAKQRYVPEMRTCKTCRQDFQFTPKPKSNNAGNFCSTKCRNAGYLGSYRGKPARNARKHRPGWASISRRFRRFNNFCSGCGTTERRLVVHHIDPYWRSKNNSDSNLVTLCPKCHGRAELLSDKLSQMKKQQRETAVALIQAELHDWWHVFQGRRMLQQCK